MDKKVITVIGATGAQGGGLVRAILNDKHSAFRVRAVTRNPQSEKAQQLSSAGAEVVAGDVDDFDSLVKAFDGAHGVFCVTFFWAHFSVEKEKAEAQLMAKAAKQAGVKHVIWSTLEDTRRWVPLADNRMPTLQGNYKVPHFDGKGEADEYFRELDLPVTFLLTSFYWENFIHFGMGPKKGPDGKLAITIPMGDKKLPGIATEDIGKCAYGIFNNGSDWIGKTIGISGENLTIAQLAENFTRVLGQQVVYNNVPPEVYRNFGFPGADDLANMFQFKRDFEEYFCGARDPEVARSLNPDLQNFETWLRKNKALIPLS